MKSASKYGWRAGTNGPTLRADLYQRLQGGRPCATAADKLEIEFISEAEAHRPGTARPRERFASRSRRIAAVVGLSVPTCREGVTRGRTSAMMWAPRAGRRSRWR